MKITYVSKDVNITPSMKKAVEEKLMKFDSLFRESDEVRCVVTLSILPNHGKAVEASLSTTGVDLRAKVIADDFYNALALLVEKLNGQMRKMKTQWKKAHKTHSLSENFLMDDISEDVDVAEIVKKKKLSLAPMDVDEALTRMDALGHKFFIYLDSSTDLVNVIYERDDGTYGLIEVDQ